MKAGLRFEEFSTDNINMQMEIARKRAVKMMQSRKKHHIQDRSRRHSSIAMTFFKGDGCFGTGADEYLNIFLIMDVRTTYIFVYTKKIKIKH